MSSLKDGPESSITRVRERSNFTKLSQSVKLPWHDASLESPDYESVLVDLFGLYGQVRHSTCKTATINSNETNVLQRPSGFDGHFLIDIALALRNNTFVLSTSRRATS